MGDAPSVRPRKERINTLSTNRISQEEAETIAAQAFAYLSQDLRLFEGFMAATGVDLGQIDSFADDPGFLANVLDYTLSQEKLVVGFCETFELDPELPKAARQRLPGAPFES